MPDMPCPFEVVVEGLPSPDTRGAQARARYLYTRWLLRKTWREHGDALMAKVQRQLRNLTLYGYDPESGVRAIWGTTDYFPLPGKSITDSMRL